MRFRLTALIVATAIAAACAFPAHASTFGIQVRNNSNGGGPVDSGPAPVDSGEVIFSSDQGHPNAYRGRALAGAGILRARGLATIQGIPANSNGIGAESRASFSLDDVFITGPVGVTSVNATMNVLVSGFVDADPTPTVFAGAGFSMSINIPGSSVSGSFNDNGTVAGGTGLFAGFSGPTISGSFSSGTGSFSTTGPNVVHVSIIAGGGASSNGGIATEFGRGNSDFFDTVNFPTSGPVFNLPAGFTANSISGMIVNNQWIGVPEPGSIVLSIVGFIGLAVVRRTWRRRD